MSCVFRPGLTVTPLDWAQWPNFIEEMIAIKNFTRTTFNLVLFLFSQCVTDRDLILGSSFSTLNTSYYRGKNKESNKKAP